MTRALRIATAGLVAPFLATGAGTSIAVAGDVDWTSFTDQTEARLVADPALGAEDTEEKAYAWGDVDRDGDVDLVCVRKQPFSAPGRRVNVLFMNEGGVLVDRTALHASASDIPGDAGFLTPTNDRDVILVDVTGDGWLDIVTATTMSDGAPKHIGHPRVYANLRADAGAWEGFRHEDARIPQLFTEDKLAVNPRFNEVAAGDVNGDGALDLYFVDGDLGGQPEGHDVNDRLLVNNGAGFFTDASAALMTREMLESSLGTAATIVDMNGDGFNDVVKTSGLNAPTGILIAYNSINTAGVFDVQETIYNFAAIYHRVGDLDGDGLPDIVVTDDGTDRYLLNTGNGADGLAEFTSHALPGADPGFSGNSLIVDLDDDGLDDVLITDVDVDVPGCSRSMRIFRNLGGTPVVTFDDAPPGGLTSEARGGTHDVAVFDLDGDGWLDLVTGRCLGTQVWIGDPPFGLTFTYFGGPPRFVLPGWPAEFEVLVQGYGGAVPVLGSGMLHVSVDGGPFVAQPLQEQMGNLYRGTLPALECTERVRYYLSAQESGGGVFTDPPGAPLEHYTAYGAGVLQAIFADDFEGDVFAWTVESENLQSGAWEAVDPVGTVNFDGPAAPEDDATAGDGNVRAFVTENGVPGGSAGETDVDGGPTHLISPTFDLDGTDAEVRYARWHYTSDAGSDQADPLFVDVSNDGGATWAPALDQTTEGTTGAGTFDLWETASFVIGDVLTPTSQVRVRFRVMDVPNNSVTESAIDDFQVRHFSCTVLCVADLDESGDVGFDDLLQVLAAWGPCPPSCPEDIDGSGDVGFGDLIELLSAWGACP